MRTASENETATVCQGDIMNSQRETGLNLYIYIGSILLQGILSAGEAGADGMPGDQRLWYRQPASQWEEALPLGNGRLGCMLFGTAPVERLQLNEESLWAGEPADVYPRDFANHLGVVQKHVLEDRIEEARAYGLENLTQSPTSFRSYEPFADLWIDMGHDASVVENYRRELDLGTGVARVSYSVGGVRFAREVFLSAVDDVLVVRLGASKPEKLQAKVWLSREKDTLVTAVARNRLHLDGRIVDVATPGGYDDNAGGSGAGGEHMRFAGRLSARAVGGSVSTSDDAVQIEGADEAVLLFTGTTDFNLDKMNSDPTIDPGKDADRILAKASTKSWTELLRDHVAEHRSYFDRVSLDLGGTERDELPTDERLAAYREGKDDPRLVVLYFQYGRYLLMSSSRRPGRLPANLQGIWNDKMWAPWESDYHLNINLQMNYWPADLCNLPETMTPLVDWFSNVTEKGRVTADRLYGARGWLSHTTVSLFGRTSPGGSNKESQFMNGVLDPLAGAWMSMTLWRHYEFTGDLEFLAQRAYPILKGACEFLLDFLVEDADGLLVIVPSTSPENAYIHPETGKALRITRGSTYHTTLVRVVFEATLEASRLLERDEEFREELESALAKLPPIKVGQDGTIQEWIEDYEEENTAHRHVSHLLGLYPFSLITSQDRRLFEAAEKTIERRGHGGDVGWSNAWKTCFFARLHDGEKAHWYLSRLIGRNAFPNLMNACWPGRLYQIDGNFGGCAGIVEMLLQSHAGEIGLLPASPGVWPEGEIRGVRARGGFVVDFAWREGKVVSFSIRATRNASLRLRIAERLLEREMEAGELFSE